MTKIIFTHDDEVQKWTVHVEGVANKKEARQAFTAVVMTCQMLNANIQHRALVDDENQIHPAVSR